MCRDVPQGKERSQARSREPLFAVAANVLQIEIPERHVREPVGDRGCHRGAHALLVDLVGAGVRNIDDAKGQTRGAGLCFEHLASHSVHRHPIHRFVDGRQ